MAHAKQNDFDLVSQNMHSSMTFPQKISAHFRRPSKVTKPNSRNPSPRTASRRRLTGNFPTRTRSVVERQKPQNGGTDQSFVQGSHTRPLSWHSSFAPGYANNQMLGQQFYQSPPELNYHGSVFAHGLITPSPLPVDDSAYLDPQIVPFNLMSTQDFSFSTNHSVQPNLYPYEYDVHVSNYTPSSIPTHDVLDYQIQTMAWAPLPNSNFPNITTAPASPDFTACSQVPSQPVIAQIDCNVDKDELVGMGLYDSPAQVQSANLLFGGSMVTRRKNLKLEESFEPSPPSDTDDDDDDDAESEPETLLEQRAVFGQEVHQEGCVGIPFVSNPIHEYYHNLSQEQPCFIPTYNHDVQMGPTVPMGWI